MDAEGNFVWAKRMGGDNNQGNSIAVDMAGNVYTTGRFEGTGDFDPGAEDYYLTSVGFSDVFISKLDAGGNFVWAKRMGGTDEGGTYPEEGCSIVVDILGNIYTTGTFVNTADLVVGAEDYYLTSAGEVDIFIIKYSQESVSVSEVEQATNTFSVYPNPSNGLFIIETDEQGTKQYHVYDGAGKLVLSGTNTSQRFTIDISHLPYGMYMLKLN